MAIKYKQWKRGIIIISWSNLLKIFVENFDQTHSLFLEEFKQCVQLLSSPFDWLCPTCHKHLPDTLHNLQSQHFKSIYCNRLINAKAWGVCLCWILHICPRITIFLSLWNSMRNCIILCCRIEECVIPLYII